MIVNQRNDLRTVLWKLIENGEADEGSVLGALREGTLVASVTIPAIFQRVVPVPANYWEGVDEDHFDRAVDSKSGPQRMSPFRIPLDLYVAEERAVIKALGEAIIARDPKKIPDQVREWFSPNRIAEPSHDSGWEQLMSQLVEWSHNVGDMAGHEEIAFVTKDDLVTFYEHIQPSESQAGGQRDPEAWSNIWRELARLLLKADTTGKKANAWAEDLVVWQKANRLGNSALKKDTLQREISKLMK